MNESFGKEYKLCSKKIMDELFTSGKKNHCFPFLAIHLFQQLDTPVPFQVTISVPKRSFRKAHERNRIKRLVRECVRKNKLLLEEVLMQNQQQLALFLIYRHSEELDYETLMLKTRKLFLTLNESIRTHEK